MKFSFKTAMQLACSLSLLYAGSGFAQNASLPPPACSSALPGATSHTVAYIDYKKQAGQVTFWQRDNYCYGDSAVWWEPGSAAYLTQRASVYTATNPATDPVGTKRPVVIFTHPNGQTEKFMYKDSTTPSDNPYATSTLFQSVLVQALNAGYTVITLEFRHPVASYDTKLNQTPGNTDIRDGIQFMRYNAAQLHIDPDNLFLVGQSRGSLNMLWGIKDNAAGTDAQRPWRSASSKANAIWDYQAQTCYDRNTVENKFILPSSYAAFESDPKFPEPLDYQAGCALNAVGNSLSIPPMVLMYDEAPVDISNVTQQEYCRTDWSEQFCWKKKKWHDPDNIWNAWFDEHDANFGVAMNKAYGHAGADKKIQACYGVTITYDDPSGPWNGYRGYTNFFDQYRTVPVVSAAAPFQCPQVTHTPPPN
ncbi:hypothetical protein [Undibacterium sp. TS12]|uniref:hypothetical protein n=1 Tax=Undibacterium sp. TS12 TaxID=2908202 RepID=UPI001F4C7706|nr:hypothetical protein [Undibacterium sp. TS12]MCH8620437.1 hypothetical protein [Undibacterium sp. TS12]